MTEKPVVLVVDVGGSHVKVRTSAAPEARRVCSRAGPAAQQMVDGVLELVRGWDYDVVTVGIPPPVHGGKPIAEPVNLGDGWIGFDYEGAFGKPTRLVN